MRALQTTVCAGHIRGRTAVCALLILLLLLSGISVDVFVTHVHDDGPVHTHASRTLSTRDLHQHHDSHHDHHHPSLPVPSSGQNEVPAGPGTESESTVVISSQGNLIRQNRDTAKRVLDLLPAAFLVQPASVEVICSFPQVRKSSGSERPTSAEVLRCTVLLI